MIRFYNGLFASLFALAMVSGPAFAQSVQVKDANGNIQTIRAPNANGRAAASSSGPVVLSNEDLTAIGSLFKAGQSIGNTSFGISGSLPGFATTPTFNVGTMPNLTISSQTLPTGAATEATLATLGSKLDTLHADNTTTAPTNLPPSDPTDQARATAITTAVTALNANTTGTGSIGMVAGGSAPFTPGGQSTVAFELTGTWTGTLTLQMLVGSTWVNVSAVPAGGGGTLTSTITTNGVYEMIAGGKAQIRLSGAAGGTGTVTVNWFGTNGAAQVSARQSNPLNFNASTVLDSRINDGAGNLLAVQFAPINVSASGSNTIVAAVAGKRIKVLGVFVLSSAGDTLTFQDGATPVTGPFPFAAGQGLSEATTPYGLFQTSAGNALTLNLSSAGQVSGHVSYVVY